MSGRIVTIRRFIKQLTTRSLKEQDMVSSAHPESNLRLVKLGVPERETATEKEYRVRMNELQEWNHNYWKQHNESFSREKECFIESKKSSDGQVISYDEMSIFYKKFLEKNQKKHMQYSGEYYLRHLMLLGPAVKSLVASTIRKVSLVTKKNWHHRNQKSDDSR